MGCDLAAGEQEARPSPASGLEAALPAGHGAVPGAGLGSTQGPTPGITKVHHLGPGHPASY